MLVHYLVNALNRQVNLLDMKENEKLFEQKCSIIFNDTLLILCVKYFYNRLRFKAVIDKSCRGHFFRTQCITLG